jgi:hypothetical protein
VGGSLDFSQNWEVYFKVDNVANVDPPPSPPIAAAPNSDGSNPQLFDTIGRMFHVGIRVQG